MWTFKNVEEKVKGSSVNILYLNLFLWFWYIGDRTSGGLRRWCFLECAYYHSASLQIVSLVPVLRTEVPGGGEIGLSSSYPSGFCLWQAEHSWIYKDVLALWLWGSNTKTWHFTLSSCFSVAWNENLKTEWGQHIYSPAFALLRSGNGKVNR